MSDSFKGLDLDLWIKDTYDYESKTSDEIANVSDIIETLKESLGVVLLEYTCGGGESVELTEEQLKDLYYQTCDNIEDSTDYLFYRTIDFLDDNNLCYSVNTEDDDIEEINLCQNLLFFEFLSNKSIIINI